MVSFFAFSLITILYEFTKFTKPILSKKRRAFGKPTVLIHISSFWN